MNDTIKFVPNTPQVLKLADPTGDLVDGQVLYPTVDGRTLCLPRHAAVKLNQLFVEAGEEISIGRYRKAEDQPAEWVFSLTARTEQERAKEQMERDEEQSRSFERALDGRRQSIPLSAHKDKFVLDAATGISEERRCTPALSPQQKRKRDAGTPPPRVSYRTALSDITKAVTGLLRETGEQWNDQAKQDLVSTVFISAAKTGQMVFDFDSAEGEGK